LWDISGASQTTATLSLENLAIVKLSGILLFLEMTIKNKYCSYLCNCLCFIDAAPNLWEGNRDSVDTCFVVYSAMSAGKSSWEFKISRNKSYLLPSLVPHLHWHDDCCSLCAAVSLVLSPHHIGLIDGFCMISNFVFKNYLSQQHYWLILYFINCSIPSSIPLPSKSTDCLSLI
jgi:hypothetical protein